MSPVGLHSLLLQVLPDFTGFAKKIYLISYFNCDFLSFDDVTSSCQQKRCDRETGV